MHELLLAQVPQVDQGTAQLASDGMLIGHLVNENIVWVTDLYSPLRDKDRSEGFVAFYESLKKLGIAPDRVVGGHGGFAPASTMEAIMATK